MIFITIQQTSPAQEEGEESQELSDWKFFISETLSASLSDRFTPLIKVPPETSLT